MLQKVIQIERKGIYRKPKRFKKYINIKDFFVTFYEIYLTKAQIIISYCEFITYIGVIL